MMDVGSVSNLGLSTGLTSAATDQTTSTTTSSNTSVTKDQFLQLLVAQLKNQDPLNPVNNTDFLAQLASFSSLEQLISINNGMEQLAGITTDVTSIKNELDQLAGTTTGKNATDTTSQTNS